MLKIVAFIGLFTMAAAYSEIDLSDLFDEFLREVVDSRVLADGSFQTTYFHIPHRSAPGLIEPFIFGTRANATQIALYNVKRLTRVFKETRRQQVFDGEDFDYSVMATTVSADIEVNGLSGNLTNAVGGTEKGEYLLNGNLHNLVMNVTLETGNVIIPVRKLIPTIEYMTVVGNGEERALVESVSAQIVGDLATTLFYKTLREFPYSDAAKFVEQYVTLELKN